MSPDEASLALREMETLGVRLERLEKSTNEIANWLRLRQEIESVFHPPLPDCPGHSHWVRDFTGSSSVFSILFLKGTSRNAVEQFADSLKLFKAGYSWGGVTSLVMTYPLLDRPDKDYEGRIVRLNIGLEEAEDLIADLHQALSGIS